MVSLSIIWSKKMKVFYLILLIAYVDISAAAGTSNHNLCLNCNDAKTHNGNEVCFLCLLNGDNPKQTIQFFKDCSKCQKPLPNDYNDDDNLCPSCRKEKTYAELAREFKAINDLQDNFKK
ncbi:uncharacterized protein LOC126894590 isoform X2 [Daktulosphaira vitifoliae]|uniref:uncharacterized protein LOC126894590 isoform X2 n=1 Tax=Daktulosphaira vitifoliae TaxID=58002 RepID=UPI0021AA8DF1|nr:uncharacterized protein LOC126894590 isoform X2 [Daktulosphaira vitifoliae]